MGKTSRLTVIAAACLLVGRSPASDAHDVSTNVTWNREISRIFTARCAPCHQPGGQAFPLLTYEQVKPWTGAIKDTVLRREMPPWGAVKGFGSFRNEEALGQAELELLRAWVDGGAPEGNPDHLELKPRIQPLAAANAPEGSLLVGERYRFERPFVLDGFVVKDVPAKGNAQITIEFPDGRIESLVWLDGYRRETAHPFLLRKPLRLPVGARLQGLSGASLLMFPLKTH